MNRTLSGTGLEATPVVFSKESGCILTLEAESNGLHYSAEQISRQQNIQTVV